MNFKEFVISRRKTDSPRGDFVEDCKSLIKLGKMPNFHSLGALVEFIRWRHACPEALREARKLWKEYTRLDTQ